MKSKMKYIITIIISIISLTYNIYAEPFVPSELRVFNGYPSITWQNSGADSPFYKNGGVYQIRLKVNGSSTGYTPNSVKGKWVQEGSNWYLIESGTRINQTINGETEQVLDLSWVEDEWVLVKAPSGTNYYAYYIDENGILRGDAYTEEGDIIEYNKNGTRLTRTGNTNLNVYETGAWIPYNEMWYYGWVTSTAGEVILSALSNGYAIIKDGSTYSLFYFSSHGMIADDDKGIYSSNKLKDVEKRVTAQMNQHPASIKMISGIELDTSQPWYSSVVFDQPGAIRFNTGTNKNTDTKTPNQIGNVNTFKAQVAALGSEGIIVGPGALKNGTGSHGQLSNYGFLEMEEMARVGMGCVIMSLGETDWTNSGTGWGNLYNDFNNAKNTENAATILNQVARMGAYYGANWFNRILPHIHYTQDINGTIDAMYMKFMVSNPVGFASNPIINSDFGDELAEGFTQYFLQQEEGVNNLSYGNNIDAQHNPAHLQIKYTNVISSAIIDPEIKVSGKSDSSKTVGSVEQQKTNYYTIFHSIGSNLNDFQANCDNDGENHSQGGDITAIYKQTGSASIQIKTQTEIDGDATHKTFYVTGGSQTSDPKCEGEITLSSEAKTGWDKSIREAYSDGEEFLAHIYGLYFPTDYNMYFLPEQNGYPTKLPFIIQEGDLPIDTLGDMINVNGKELAGDADIPNVVTKTMYPFRMWTGSNGGRYSDAFGQTESIPLVDGSPARETEVMNTINGKYGYSWSYPYFRSRFINIMDYSAWNYVYQVSNHAMRVQDNMIMYVSEKPVDKRTIHVDATWDGHAKTIQGLNDTGILGANGGDKNVVVNGGSALLLSTKETEGKTSEQLKDIELCAFGLTGYINFCDGTEYNYTYGPVTEAQGVFGTQSGFPSVTGLSNYKDSIANTDGGLNAVDLVPVNILPQDSFEAAKPGDKYWETNGNEYIYSQGNIYMKAKSSSQYFPSQQITDDHIYTSDRYNFLDSHAKEETFLRVTDMLGTGEVPSVWSEDSYFNYDECPPFRARSRQTHFKYHAGELKPSEPYECFYNFISDLKRNLGHYKLRKVMAEGVFKQGEEKEFESVAKVVGGNGRVDEFGSFGTGSATYNQSRTNQNNAIGNKLSSESKYHLKPEYDKDNPHSSTIDVHQHHARVDYFTAEISLHNKVQDDYSELVITKNMRQVGSNTDYDYRIQIPIDVIWDASGNKLNFETLKKILKGENVEGVIGGASSQFKEELLELEMQTGWLRDILTSTVHLQGKGFARPDYYAMFPDPEHRFSTNWYNEGTHVFSIARLQAWFSISIDVEKIDIMDPNLCGMAESSYDLRNWNVDEDETYKVMGKTIPLKNKVRTFRYELTPNFDYLGDEDNEPFRNVTTIDSKNIGLSDGTFVEKYIDAGYGYLGTMVHPLVDYNFALEGNSRGTPVLQYVYGSEGITLPPDEQQRELSVLCNQMLQGITSKFMYLTNATIEDTAQ